MTWTDAQLNHAHKLSRLNIIDIKNWIHHPLPKLSLTMGFPDSCTDRRTSSGLWYGADTPAPWWHKLDFVLNDSKTPGRSYTDFAIKMFKTYPWLFILVNDLRVASIKRPITASSYHTSVKLPQSCSNQCAKAIKSFCRAPGDLVLGPWVEAIGWVRRIPIMDYDDI